MAKGKIMSVKDTEAVKLAMREKGIVQVELADRMGVYQSTISQALNRKRIGTEVF